MRHLSELESLLLDRHALDVTDVLLPLSESTLLALFRLVRTLGCLGELTNRDGIRVRRVLQSILDMIKLPLSVHSHVENRLLTEGE